VDVEGAFASFSAIALLKLGFTLRELQVSQFLFEVDVSDERNIAKANSSQLKRKQSIASANPDSSVGREIDS